MTREQAEAQAAKLTDLFGEGYRAVRMMNTWAVESLPRISVAEDGVVVEPGTITFGPQPLFA